MHKQARYCLLGLLVALFLGLTLVWVNIEMIDLSYSVKHLQQKVHKEEMLKAKLEVEKKNLTSSYQLQKQAPRFGLQPPTSSQVRRLP